MIGIRTTFSAHPFSLPLCGSAISTLPVGAFPIDPRPLIGVTPWQMPGVFHPFAYAAAVGGSGTGAPLPGAPSTPAGAAGSGNRDDDPLDHLSFRDIKALVTSLQQQIAELAERRDVLVRQLSQAELAVAKKDAEVDRLNEQLTAVRTNYAHDLEELGRVQAARQQLEADLVDARRNFDELREQHEELKGQVKAKLSLPISALQRVVGDLSQLKEVDQVQGRRPAEIAGAVAAAAQSLTIIFKILESLRIAIDSPADRDTLPSPPPASLPPEASTRSTRVMKQLARLAKNAETGSARATLLNELQEVVAGKNENAARRALADAFEKKYAADEDSDLLGELARKLLSGEVIDSEVHPHLARAMGIDVEPDAPVAGTRPGIVERPDLIGDLAEGSVARPTLPSPPPQRTREDLLQALIQLWREGRAEETETRRVLRELLAFPGTWSNQVVREVHNQLGIQLQGSAHKEEVARLLALVALYFRDDLAVAATDAEFAEEVRTIAQRATEGLRAGPLSGNRILPLLLHALIEREGPGEEIPKSPPPAIASAVSSGGPQAVPSDRPRAPRSAGLRLVPRLTAAPPTTPPARIAAPAEPMPPPEPLSARMQIVTDLREVEMDHAEVEAFRDHVLDAIIEAIEDQPDNEAYHIAEILASRAHDLGKGDDPRALDLGDAASAYAPDLSLEKHRLLTAIARAFDVGMVMVGGEGEDQSLAHVLRDTRLLIRKDVEGDEDADRFEGNDGSRWIPTRRHIRRRREAVPPTLAAPESSLFASEVAEAPVPSVPVLRTASGEPSVERSLALVIDKLSGRDPAYEFLRTIRGLLEQGLTSDVDPREVQRLFAQTIHWFGLTVVQRHAANPDFQRLIRQLREEKASIDFVVASMMEGVVPPASTAPARRVPLVTRDGGGETVFDLIPPVLESFGNHEQLAQALQGVFAFYDETSAQLRDNEPATRRALRNAIIGLMNWNSRYTSRAIGRLLMALHAQYTELWGSGLPELTELHLGTEASTPPYGVPVPALEAASVPSPETPAALAGEAAAADALPSRISGLPNLTRTLRTMHAENQLAVDAINRIERLFLVANTLIDQNPRKANIRLERALADLADALRGQSDPKAAQLLKAVEHQRSKLQRGGTPIPRRASDRSWRTLRSIRETVDRFRSDVTGKVASEAIAVLDRCFSGDLAALQTDESRAALRGALNMLKRVIPSSLRLELSELEDVLRTLEQLASTGRKLSGDRIFLEQERYLVGVPSGTSRVREWQDVNAILIQTYGRDRFTNIALTTLDLQLRADNPIADRDPVEAHRKLEKAVSGVKALSLQPKHRALVFRTIDPERRRLRALAEAAQQAALSGPAAIPVAAMDDGEPETVVDVNPTRGASGIAIAPPPDGRGKT